MPTVSETIVDQRQCACGCGQWFTPYRRTQKYITDHRFAAYTIHACPECGVSHRKGVAK